MRSMIWLYVALLFLVHPLHADDRPKLLGMGDSILSWNGLSGDAVPYALGRTLGADVTQRATPGARLSNPGAGALFGFDIRRQFPGGQFDLIVLNGGANDMLSECGCGACTPVLDALIAPDLSGEIPDFLTRLSRHSPRIVWVGYYLTGRPGPFAGCTPFITELDARVERLAARTPGLEFVDSDPAIDPANDAHFARDDVHPSRLGARRIAALVAQRLGGL